MLNHRTAGNSAKPAVLLLHDLNALALLRERPVTVVVLNNGRGDDRAVGQPRVASGVAGVDRGEMSR